MRKNIGFVAMRWN